MKNYKNSFYITINELTDKELQVFIFFIFINCVFHWQLGIKLERWVSH